MLAVPRWLVKPIAVGAAVLLAVACQEPPDSRLQPDDLLRAELGLTASDRVYRIRLSGNGIERADPMLVSIEPGAYVEFVTTDWLVHEILFEADSLDAEQRAFLEGTDQLESPPLIERDERYVLSFLRAPAGRYVYRLEGNGRPGRGVIVVASSTPE